MIQRFIPSSTALVIAKQADPYSHNLTLNGLKESLKHGPWLVSYGAKLYMKKQGCVCRFFLSGYSFDGEDVRNCVRKAEAA